MNMDTGSRMSISRILSVLMPLPQPAAPQEQADAQAEQGYDNEEVEAGIVVVADDIFGVAADSRP